MRKLAVQRGRVAAQEEALLERELGKVEHMVRVRAGPQQTHEAGGDGFPQKRVRLYNWRQGLQKVTTARGSTKQKQQPCRLDVRQLNFAACKFHDSTFSSDQDSRFLAAPGRAILVRNARLRAAGQNTRLRAAGQALRRSGQGLEAYRLPVATEAL